MAARGSREDGSPPARPRVPPELRRRVLKVLISLFCVLNVATVLYANRPSWATSAVDGALDRHLSPWQAYRVRLLGWMSSRYAHLSGLDNRWQMFGRQSRFNWWFRIVAIAPDGAVNDLPLPLQSERTFLQANFFDFREAKYHLNLYADEDLRTRYARYLCRRFPVVNGATTASIRIFLHHQQLVDRATARARGTHLEPHSYARVLQEVSCAR
jgi:hypothetical protein